MFYIHFCLNICMQLYNVEFLKMYFNVTRLPLFSTPIVELLHVEN